MSQRIAATTPAAAAGRHTMPAPTPDDFAWQGAILQGVSRTFALTIPQLPPDLHTVVGNAYLLCRIADTIEDSETLSVEEKAAYSERFHAVVAGEAEAANFGAELAPRLGAKTLEAERELVARTDAVVRITHSFPDDDQAALLRCVRIMVEGMERFQEGQYTAGLDDLDHLHTYCYYVAGVVGEMLTALFCNHSPACAARRAELERLAVSFGQGLQMTNILKDIWDDRQRNVCWLPRTAFDDVDLGALAEGQRNPAFEAGLGRLIGVARGHLEDALDYTLTIPKEEQGIRQFCLWALGMAVLTLRRINAHRDFSSGAQVKISRRAVKATIATCKLLGRRDAALRAAFRMAAAGLPRG
jgi:farnesyl-diphosphate farnesyltransferase